VLVLDFLESHVRCPAMESIYVYLLEPHVLPSYGSNVRVMRCCLTEIYESSGAWCGAICWLSKSVHCHVCIHLTHMQLLVMERNCEDQNWCTATAAWRKTCLCTSLIWKEVERSSGMERIGAVTNSRTAAARVLLPFVENHARQSWEFRCCFYCCPPHSRVCWSFIWKESCPFAP
jgi:hypothetical protein